MAKYLIFALMFVAMISLPMAAFSQEEDVEYSDGTVVKVKQDSKEIIISEYDWDADEEVEISYSIDADTKLENIDSWKNIPIGAYVDIEYTVDANGKRTAKYISVYDEEELTESEME